MMITNTNAVLATPATVAAAVASANEALGMNFTGAQLAFAGDLVAYWCDSLRLKVNATLAEEAIFAVRRLDEEHDIVNFAQWVEYINLINS